MTRQDALCVYRACFGASPRKLSRIELGGGLNEIWAAKSRDVDQVIIKLGPNSRPRRVPRTYERQMIQREVRIEQRLSAIGELAPSSIAYGFDHSIVDRDWHVRPLYEGISGASIVRRDINAAKDKWIASQLAEIDETLRSIRGEFFGFDEPQFRSTSWLGALARIGLSMSQDVRLDSGLNVSPEELKLTNQVLEDAERRAGRVSHGANPVLRHGDLSLKNLLVATQSGRLQILKILDWERVHFAPPRSGRMTVGTLGTSGRAVVGLFSTDVTSGVHTSGVPPAGPVEEIVYLLQSLLESRNYLRIDPRVVFGRLDHLTRSLTQSSSDRRAD